MQAVCTDGNLRGWELVDMHGNSQAQTGAAIVHSQIGGTEAAAEDGSMHWESVQV